MAGILVDRRATARRRLAVRLQLGAPRAALGQWARCFRRGGRARCRGLVLSRRRRRATRPAAVPPRPHFFLETKKCMIHGGFLTGPSIKTFPCPGLVLAGGMFVKRRAGQKSTRGQVRRRGRPFRLRDSSPWVVERPTALGARRARSARVNRDFQQVRGRPNLDSRARGAPPSPVASAVAASTKLPVPPRLRAPPVRARSRVRGRGSRARSQRNSHLETTE